MRKCFKRTETLKQRNKRGNNSLQKKPYEYCAYGGLMKL